MARAPVLLREKKGEIIIPLISYKNSHEETDGNKKQILENVIHTCTSLINTFVFTTLQYKLPNICI